MSKAGFQVSQAGFQVSQAGLQASKAGFQISQAGFQVSPAGFQASKAGFQVSQSGFQVSPAGFQVSQAGFQVSPAGFQVSPAGLQAKPKAATKKAGNSSKAKTQSIVSAQSKAKTNLKAKNLKAKTNLKANTKSKAKTRIIIVGGGAAGLTAAVAAARQNAQVIILERLARVGKKLLATGNGRCNYTNTNLDISRYHGKQPKFAMGILSHFGSRETIEFFKELGIVPMVEEKGKVFPHSGQAGSVLDVLRFELEQLGVETICDAEVTSIEPAFEIVPSSKVENLSAAGNNLTKESAKAFFQGASQGSPKNLASASASSSSPGFLVKAADGSSWTADRVILAAGGKAAPNLGSNGSGFSLAEGLGHTVIAPFPALVKLKLKADFLKQLAGIKFEGTAEIIHRGKVLAADSGEILFATYGISGPPILQISRAADEILQKGEIPQVKLNMFPNFTQDELKALLWERFETQSRKPLDFSFVGFINKQLAPVVIKEAGISHIKKPAGEVTSQERKQLLNLLQDWRFDIIDTLPWSQAQVTAGGIAVSEINPKTMESRLIPGLYFAGEIVDIDGDSGGFNLQWAWASGWTAGVSAASH